MKPETVMQDIAKLITEGCEDDALVILMEFKKKILYEYRKWHQKNHGIDLNRQYPDLILHSYYINEFLKSKIK